MTNPTIRRIFNAISGSESATRGTRWLVVIAVICSFQCPLPAQAQTQLAATHPPLGVKRQAIPGFGRPTGWVDPEMAYSVASAFLGATGLTLALGAASNMAEGGSFGWGVAGTAGGGMALLLSSILVVLVAADAKAGDVPLGLSIASTGLAAIAVSFGIVNLVMVSKKKPKVQEDTSRITNRAWHKRGSGDIARHNSVSLGSFQ